jgi:hypothetical protein
MTLRMNIVDMVDDDGTVAVVSITDDGNRGEPQGRLEVAPGPGARSSRCGCRCWGRGAEEGSARRPS